MSSLDEMVFIAVVAEVGPCYPDLAMKKTLISSPPPEKAYIQGLHYKRATKKQQYICAVLGM